MAEYYPAYLDITGRPAVVIGGGSVAQRKVEGLLKAGARVTVVSPEAAPGIQQWARAGAIIWSQRQYRAGDLQDAWLAIAATGSEPVNVTVAREAEERGVLLNVVDNPKLCTFIAPAVVEREGLTIAVSTGGKSPAMARRVKEELEQLLPPEYGLLLEVAGEVREALRREGSRPPADLWQQALSPEVLMLVREGKPDDARDRLLQSLRSGAATARGG